MTSVYKPNERKLRRVGNSMTLTIPPKVLECLNLKEGDKVTFSVSENEIILKRNNSKRRKQ